MSFAAIGVWWEQRTRWERAAIAVWMAVLLFVCARSFLRPNAKTVYPIYSASGAFWLTGIDLYAPDRPEDAQGGYRYSPTFAILCTPFAWLPDDFGGVVWRLIFTGGLLAAMFWLTRVASLTPMSPNQVAWFFLLSLPLSIQSVNNGQANILIAATFVASVAAAAQGRWNLVAVLVAVGFACKVYPLALGLLLMIVYPRPLGWRIPLAVVASLLLPFVTQHPDYVIDQYTKWLAVLHRDDRSDIELDQAYRDLWLLIRLYDLPIHRTAYVGIQILSAAGLAGICWLRRLRGWPERSLLAATLALASVWMMFLGPTTESCSFILMAPAFSWSIVDAVRNDTSAIRRGMLGISATLFVAAIAMADFKRLINIHAVGVHSWAAAFYFCFLLTERQKSDAESLQIEKPQRLAA